jgi:hypothetical protein
MKARKGKERKSEEKDVAMQMEVDPSKGKVAPVL